jgi:hypothetical protein
MEEQSATAKSLAAKPSPNTTILWFLMSLSLLLVLVLMLMAWFYSYQLEPVSEGTDSGWCVQWSSEESLRPERIAGGVGPSGKPTRFPGLAPHRSGRARLTHPAPRP